MSRGPKNWEVLNGVGVDGVGVIFPFLCILPLFLRIFPLFFRFSLLLLKDKGKQQQFTRKMGNFTPTPSAPTPCKTSRKKSGKVFKSEKPGKGLEKVRRKVWKNLENVRSGLFRDFLRPAGGPTRLFSDFFGISGPKGPSDSCSSREGLQTLRLVTRPKYHPHFSLRSCRSSSVNFC